MAHRFVLWHKGICSESTDGRLKTPSCLFFKCTKKNATMKLLRAADRVATDLKTSNATLERTLKAKQGELNAVLKHCEVSERGRGSEK